MRLNELGAAVGGVDYAAVSAAVKRFERRTEREKKLARLVKRGKQLLKVDFAEELPVFDGGNGGTKSVEKFYALISFLRDIHDSAGVI
jgi:hypothetical protein